MTEKTEFEKWLDKKNARKAGRNSKNVKKNIRNKKRKSQKKIIKRSRNKKGFTIAIRTEARERSGYICENPLCKRSHVELGGEHHGLPRSQYHKADRNDSWNCTRPCTTCHSRITSPKTDSDKRLRRYFERLAVLRRDYTGEQFLFQYNELNRRLVEGTLPITRSFEPFT